MANLLTGTGISDFLTNNQANPGYQQAMLQLQNQQPINQAAWNAYNQYLGNVPQQQVAGMDPTRLAGIQNQIANATGQGQQLANLGAGTLGQVAGGVGTGQQALQNLAAGGGPQFNSNVAQQYQNFMNPSLLGAQQALNNQANLAWNKGVGNIGGVGGGFMSSGRENALGQATENAATNLGANQQQLAYNAAQQAAQAGQQAGNTGFQAQLAAGQALNNAGLQGAQLTNNLQNAGIFGGGIQEAGGTAMQQQQQNELNAQYQNQLLNQQNAFKALQYLQQGLGTLGSTTQARDISTPNNLVQLANMLGINNPQALQSLLGSAANGIGGLIGSGVNAGLDYLNKIGGTDLGGGLTIGQNGSIYGGTSLGDTSTIGGENIDDLINSWAGG